MPVGRREPALRPSPRPSLPADRAGLCELRGPRGTNGVADGVTGSLPRRTGDERLPSPRRIWRKCGTEAAEARARSRRGWRGAGGLGPERRRRGPARGRREEAADSGKKGAADRAALVDRVSIPMGRGALPGFSSVGGS
ncbi:hypothetical protein KM043_012329 [Ampulex compressa]|nr:hypothetical protein KM043_012329 [Ampulex compressa]